LACGKTIEECVKDNIVDVINRIREGNHLLFCDLAKCVHRLIHVRHKGLAPEEYYQCVLISVWKAVQLFDADRGDFLHFISSILHNEVVSYQRFASGSHHLVAIEEPIVSDASLTVSSCEEHIYHSEILHQVFTPLTPEEARVLYLKYVLDKTHAEIADECNISISKSKHMLRSGLRKVRKFYSGGEYS
jgi:RNA polymerase sigma factor (sigma-70 family)